MYVPKPFEEPREDVLHALIRAHPLGALVSAGANGLDANHIPFLLRTGASGTVLHAHVARANPVWRTLETDPRVLVIFQGMDAFITPSWYATKTETGKMVPTWNYAVVHAHGSVRLHPEPEWLRRHVGELTSSQEAGRPEPWRVEDAPADFIAKLVGAIVGLEIAVERLTGKWKLSQNQTARDREGVVAGLAGEDGDDARAMSEWIRQSLAEKTS
jgi:transcriptional regulator